MIQFSTSQANGDLLLTSDCANYFTTKLPCKTINFNK